MSKPTNKTPLYQIGDEVQTLIDGKPHGTMTVTERLPNGIYKGKSGLTWQVNDLRSLPLPALKELVTIPQWVVWKATPNGHDKPRKLPINVRTGKLASTTDPKTWGTYEEAKQAIKKFRATGLGFVFTKEAGIVGIDLDNCVDDNGNLETWAVKIITSLNSYTEWSPSGKGLHILVKGVIPSAVKTVHVEMYDTGRYFTVTGKQVERTTNKLASNQHALDVLYKQYKLLTQAKTHKTQVNETSAYGRGALTNGIQMVATSANGTRNNTLFQETCNLIKLANGGILDKTEVEQGMIAAGMAAGLSEREVRATVASAINKVGNEVREIPQLAQKNNDTSEVAHNVTPLRPILVKELMAKDFPPLVWLIEGLIAKGHLVVLGGRPKSGKSWLCLQMAKCLDVGESFLGRQTRRAKVVYVALEDGERRVRERCYLLKWQPNEAKVHFSVARFDHPQDGMVGEGISQIKLLTSDVDLVIIDTLIATLQGHVKENDNVGMARILNELARIAHDTDTAILLTHHTGKGMSDDPFNTLRGASSIRGGYDVGLVLERKQGEKEAILHAESRDVDVESMTLQQAANGAGWHYIGDAREIKKIRAGKATYEALLENDPTGEGLTANQLAKIRDVSLQAIYPQLVKLEEAEHVLRIEKESTQNGKVADLWVINSQV